MAFGVYSRLATSRFCGRREMFQKGSHFALQTIAQNGARTGHSQIDSSSRGVGDVTTDRRIVSHCAASDLTGMPDTTNLVFSKELLAIFVDAL